MADLPDLAKLKRYFTEARDLTAVARQNSLVCIDYYDSDQFTPDELAKLNARGQPAIVINRIKPAINGIIGVTERGRSDPRAWPRQPGDTDSADAATDVLRYIADFNRFKRLKQDVFRDMLVPGAGAALIGVDEDLQVTLTQIRWEEFFADPRSRRADFKDARFLGIAKWMYADDLAALYPAKGADVQASVDASVGGGMAPDESYQDRPLFGAGGSANAAWIDRKQRRLMVIELYYREAGAWRRCVFTAMDILEAGPSPYLDHKGRPDCPIEAVSAYVKRDNSRYGAVWDMIGPQDEIYWSEVANAANVDGLSFASNEMAADTTIGVAALNNQLVFFGTRSVEFWSPNTGAGLTDPAFVPNLGSSYQRGCAARDTIAYADNSLFWVGDNRVVYRVGNVPTRISSSSIEDKLRQCSNIGGCTAFVVTFEGHELYVLNIPGIGSYAYDISRIGTTAGAYGDSYERGEWSAWTSFGRTSFRGRCAAAWNGQQLIGDDTTNDIGAMQVGTWTDYGAPIERIASAFIKIEEGAPRCDSLVLHAVMGVGNPTDPGSNPVAEMRWSDDGGRTFGDWRPAPLGAQGRYRNRAVWRRLGAMRAPGRLIEVRITDPIDAAISHLELSPSRPGQ